VRGDARSHNSRPNDDDFSHVRGTSIALSEGMRLQPIDVYILDYFRRNARLKIDLAELTEQCRTYPCGDIEAAITRLEREAHLLRRLADGREWLELTREGRRYAGLAAAESLERWEPLEARL